MWCSSVWPLNPPPLSPHTLPSASNTQIHLVLVENVYFRGSFNISLHIRSLKQRLKLLQTSLMFTVASSSPPPLPNPPDPPVSVYRLLMHSSFTKTGQCLGWETTRKDVTWDLTIVSTVTLGISQTDTASAAVCWGGGHLTQKYHRKKNLMAHTWVSVLQRKQVNKLKPHRSMCNSVVFLLFHTSICLYWRLCASSSSVCLLFLKTNINPTIWWGSCFSNYCGPLMPLCLHTKGLE